jgi:hypothetical protein
MSFGPQPSPFELDMLAHQERETRARLDLARKRHMTDDGEIPHEHHHLIRTLEAESKKAVERLEHARQA